MRRPMKSAVANFLTPLALAAMICGGAKS